MPVLFVSHSSKDDALADDLGSWLKANGFSDVFIDQKSIAAGEKWDDALQRAAGSCRAVLLLVTPNWLTSAECYGEFKAAWYMGKRIVPLFLGLAGQEFGVEETKRLQSVCRQDQGVDITCCLDANRHLNLDTVPDITEGLKTGLRAAGAMIRVGLDPEAFAIDMKLRPSPFPGLTSFGDEDADAALFYGRSREIAQTLEELRVARAKPDARPFVILGASGAGKSSLLKAGIIPRLRRETPAWLPLRAFRPGADPLLNFAEAIAKTLNDFGEREAYGVLRDRLFDAWERAGRDGKGKLLEEGAAVLAFALEAEGARLRKAANRAGATILVSVDQAEEMVRTDGPSAEALADYLRVALATANSPWQLAFTIRTDSFPELQSHRRFQDLEARAYDLRAIPVFRFDSVVEEPCERYGVAVEPDLVYALMEDAPKEDALPLLAFGLQRLWRQYAASGALTRTHYDKVGGLQGLIEGAAERAMRGIEPGEDAPLPAMQPPKRQTELAAATFVPALVDINEQGATIRHIAEWAKFSEESQELLKRFDRWRLVVRKGEADGGTVEVAHEALFRTWRRLENWLELERTRLVALRTLQVDARNWQRMDRNEIFLNHRSKRLDEAIELSEHPFYMARLSVLDFAYIVSCFRMFGVPKIFGIFPKLDLLPKEGLPSKINRVALKGTALLYLAAGFFGISLILFFLCEFSLTYFVLFAILSALSLVAIFKLYIKWRKHANMITATLARLELLARDYISAKRTIFKTYMASFSQKILRAHILMFCGEIDKARKIYMGYKGSKNAKENQSRDNIILKDFDIFEQLGMVHPLMGEIRIELKREHGTTS